MRAAARKLNGAARPSALAVFTARCEARALLWQAGEISLHDAVDELQAAAVRDGLVAELGQDRVQDMMVATFTMARDDLTVPNGTEEGAEATEDYRSAVPNGTRAAASTVNALMLALRKRGAAALAEPETRRRLANLSSAQVRGVLARLMALRPRYPAIDDELLFLLGEQL